MEEEANEAASSNEDDKEVSYTTERSKSATLYKSSGKTTTSISQKQSSRMKTKSNFSKRRATEAVDQAIMDF